MPACGQRDRGERQWGGVFTVLEDRLMVSSDAYMWTERQRSETVGRSIHSAGRQMDGQLRRLHVVSSEFYSENTLFTNKGKRKTFQTKRK